MKKSEIAKRRYMREVKQYFPRNKRAENAILQRIESEIEQFVIQNPTLDYSGIVARYGEPEDIATAYIDEIGYSELLKGVSFHKKIAKIIISGVLAAVVLWGVVIGIAYYNHWKNDHGHYVDIFTESNQSK